jgi:hypothetical protein
LITRLIKDYTGILEKLFFPVGKQLLAEFMFAANLGSRFLSDEKLQDHAGFECWFEGTMFLHWWNPLSGLYFV